MLLIAVVWGLFAGQPGRQRPAVLEERAVERIHPWPHPTLPSLLPRPRVATFLGGAFTDVSPITSVQIRSEGGATEADTEVLGDLEARLRATVPISSVMGSKGATFQIELRLQRESEQLSVEAADEHGVIGGPEAYALTLRGNTLRITGQRAGLVHAVQTVRQLLTSGSPLPAVEIVDAPVFAYRGLMIDNVREPHSFAFHMQMLDYLAANKMNVYQLHASDDQGYSLPSAAYPQLPFGSALNASEAKALQAKAASLGIEIVAEVDMPGHSSALLAKIPALAAIDPASGKPCGEINISNPAAIAILQTLMGEVMDMFPGQWYHLGADEVRYNDACGMTKMTYHHFINQMDAFVKSRNRTMIVWEGFDPNPGATAEVINTDVVVSPFDSVRLLAWPHRPHHYYDAGHRILNTDWNPLYLVKGGNGFVAGPDALAAWNPTKYGNYPYLGNSVVNMQSLPSDNWNSPSYHSRFTGENASCWPDATQHSSSYIPQPFPSNRLLGGAICSWANVEQVEIPIFFGNCSGEGSMLPAGFNGYPRPAPRAPIVAERFWAGALATGDDVLNRVGCAYVATPPPPAPSPPPAPGNNFLPEQGACRDPNGLYSNRLDHHMAPVNFSTCRDLCIKLGERCDAFDIDGPAPANGTDPTLPWCGIWGVTLTPNDADPALGFSFYASAGGRVCRGDVQAGSANTCYRKAPVCDL
eukprot:m.158923 g.158923  ORF g.158923 m.158923 type:complete len:699 (-) comp14513_c1_seq4:69-2165(-)